MTIKPFLVDGNLVVNEATITNSGTSIVLPTNSHFSGGGNIFNLSTNTTDDITQGTTNLYFTNTKADARADLRISAASITALSDADQTVQTTDNVTFNNITSTGYIAGPASFTIDPAAVGDNTGTVVIAGNLTVNGTTTTVNSNTVNIGDNILVLNSDETGTPSQNAGIEIERGTSTNVSLRFNETTDTWQFTNDGTTYNDLGTSDIVNDTTPQLGGNLDLNSNNITGTGDISVTGNISASGDITTTNSGSTTNVMKLRHSSSGTHEIHVDPTNASNYSALRLSVDGDAFMYLSATSSNVFFSKPIALSNTASTITFEGATSNSFETTLGVADPTADRTITFPDATGTVALTSDIPSLSGYLQNVVDDTTPQLGGNLDTNGKNINFGDSATAGTDDTLQFGAGNDLQIYHDSANTYIDNKTGHLYIRNDNDGGNIYIENRSGTRQMEISYDLGVFVYHQGDIAYKTTSNFGAKNFAMYYNPYVSGTDPKVTLSRSGSGGTVVLKPASFTSIIPSPEIQFPGQSGTVAVFTTAPTSAITDGTAGQVLKTDGAGALSFTDQAGGAVGGGTDKTFLETDNSVNSNYTLSTNRNAMTTGPVTINSGATITVPSGQRWIIL